MHLYKHWTYKRTLDTKHQELSTLSVYDHLAYILYTYLSVYACVMCTSKRFGPDAKIVSPVYTDASTSGCGCVCVVGWGRSIITTSFEEWLHFQVIRLHVMQALFLSENARAGKTFSESLIEITYDESSIWVNLSFSLTLIRPQIHTHRTNFPKHATKANRKSCINRKIVYLHRLICRYTHSRTLLPENKN